MGTPLREGEQLIGESGESYIVVAPLGSNKPGQDSNVWSAVDAEKQEDVFILKGPSQDERIGYGWPRFQSEMVMHELFKDSTHIRRQVDRIPPRRYSSEPPTLVLEPTECTLAHARASRSLTHQEIKTIMREILLALRDIHDMGLVYADLKPDNVFLNGFRKTNDDSATNPLVAKLGDLGIVMEPAVGKVQPLAYRSPEVHFKSLIMPSADIWSWGVMCCHLLESQLNRNGSGLYEFLECGNALQAEQAIRRAMSDDFELDELEYYKNCVLPLGHSRSFERKWFERLHDAGLSSDDVDFLVWVLNPDPISRASAHEILQHKWLNDEKPVTLTAKLYRQFF